VGSGQVRCAHGILPVPAPATSLLLTGIPCYGGSIAGELCTPTGAALLRHFVTRFGPMPVLTTETIGYGLGSKTFPAANLVRAFYGETPDEADTVTALECNLDDCTGEQIAYACTALLDAGARDVFTTAIQMKKGRPGVLLRCLCDPAQAEQMTRLLFLHTTTLGVRRASLERSVLSRRSETVKTPYGDIRVKISSGYGVVRKKAEYDDLAAAAARCAVPIAQVRAAAEGK
ncbi:MAG: LarC family nickel insertion protein, partial [Oscillospiraceae bacterium]|nr:LarC family nickel insertion protein [Oscillospiraceae bacterium]